MINPTNRVNKTKYFTEKRFSDWVCKEYEVLRKYVTKNLDILDIGSMDGRVGFMIIDDLEIPLSSLTLTDYTDHYVSLIKKNIKDSDNIIVSKQDVVNLSLKSLSYDVVTCFGGVLNLLYRNDYGGKNENTLKNYNDNLIRAISECSRVLKKGGIFIFEIEISSFEFINNELISRQIFIIDVKNISSSASNHYYLCCGKKR